MLAGTKRPESTFVYYPEVTDIPSYVPKGEKMGKQYQQEKEYAMSMLKYINKKKYEKVVDQYSSNVDGEEKKILQKQLINSENFQEKSDDEKLMFSLVFISSGENQRRLPELAKRLTNLSVSLVRQFIRDFVGQKNNDFVKFFNAWKTDPTISDEIKKYRKSTVITDVKDSELLTEMREKMLKYAQENYEVEIPDDVKGNYKKLLEYITQNVMVEKEELQTTVLSDYIMLAKLCKIDVEKELQNMPIIADKITKYQNSIIAKVDRPIVEKLQNMKKGQLETLVETYVTQEFGDVDLELAKNYREKLLSEFSDKVETYPKSVVFLLLLQELAENSRDENIVEMAKFLGKREKPKRRKTILERPPPRLADLEGDDKYEDVEEKEKIIEGLKVKIVEENLAKMEDLQGKTLGELYDIYDRIETKVQGDDNEKEFERLRDMVALRKKISKLIGIPPVNISNDREQIQRILHHLLSKEKLREEDEEIIARLTEFAKTRMEFLVKQNRVKVRGKKDFEQATIHDFIEWNKETEVTGFRAIMEQTQINELLNGSITKEAENVAKSAISNVFRSLVKEKECPFFADYEKSDSEYIKTVINTIKKRATNARELFSDIAGILVYVGLREADYFRGKISVQYYLPEILPNLSPEEKLPEIFLKEEKQQKENYAQYIDLKISDMVEKLGRKYFDAYHGFTLRKRNVEPPTRKVPDICDKYSGDGGDTVVYYSDPVSKETHCFNIKILLANFSSGNFKDPFTDRAFTAEFINAISVPFTDSTGKKHYLSVDELYQQFKQGNLKFEETGELFDKYFVQKVLESPTLLDWKNKVEKQYTKFEALLVKCVNGKNLVDKHPNEVVFYKEGGRLYGFLLENLVANKKPVEKNPETGKKFSPEFIKKIAGYISNKEKRVEKKKEEKKEEKESVEKAYSFVIPDLWKIAMESLSGKEEEEKKPDYLQVLGINPGITAEELKTLYSQIPNPTKEQKKAYRRTMKNFSFGKEDEEDEEDDEEETTTEERSASESDEEEDEEDEEEEEEEETTEEEHDHEHDMEEDLIEDEDTIDIDEEIPLPLPPPPKFRICSKCGQCANNVVSTVDTKNNPDVLILCTVCIEKHL
jgi:hypothetical protein